MSSVVILISVEHKENRRLLKAYLGQYYRIIELNSADTLNDQFDLAIFDGYTLNQLWEEVEARKVIEKSLFLPFLLVTSRQDVRMVTRQLGKHIDELIFTPIEKIELLARVEVLLRARRLSLELAGKNIELQLELVAHSETITALRESEVRIRLLQSLTGDLASTITPSELADSILNRVVNAVEGNLGIMGVIHPETKALEILANQGFTEELFLQYKQMVLDRLMPISKVVSTGKPVWVETLDEYREQYPQIVTFLHQIGTQAVASLPLSIKEEVIGGITIFFPNEKRFTNDEKVFLQAVAQQFAQALERERLYEEERENAVIEERHRLARELHDGVSQNLASINVLGQMLPRMLKKDPERALGIAQDVVKLAQAAMSGMRALLLELRPASIVKVSLSELITQLIHTVQARRKITVSSAVEIEQPLPEEIHLALYRIVQEGLTNVVKHSEATEASVSLKFEDNLLVLRIRDNGHGFDPQSPTGGLGLKGMQERAALIGASYEVLSTNGNGTEIIVSHPIPL